MARKNLGFLSAPPKPTDYRFGSVTGIVGEILQLDGQWDASLPDYEPQYFSNKVGTQTIVYDTLGCVSFSALNCIEALMMKKFNRVENYSDRFTAKISGTTDKGNYLYKVGDSIRKDGLVRETTWPSNAVTRTEYYADIPVNIVGQAKLFLSEYKVQYEFVWDDPSALMEALKYTPLQVAICSYGLNEAGLIKSANEQANHAVMLYGFEPGQYWKIYDSYDNKYKRYTWDLKFQGVLKYNIEENVPMPNLNENYLYQLIEGHGGFGLFVGGKLLVDDLAKILASWAVRNNGRLEGTTGVLTLAEWNATPKYNLKLEPI